MGDLSVGRKSLLAIRSVLILAFICSLMNIYQSSAAERSETRSLTIEDWQLISSSTTTASGPGVDTYMKSYPGATLPQTDYGLDSGVRNQMNMRITAPPNMHLLIDSIDCQRGCCSGVGTLDIHISVAMGLFCDFNLAYEWVAMLESIQKYPHNGTVIEGSGSSIAPTPAHYGDCIPHGAQDVVHQTLKIPWPISPREIVLKRNFVYIPPKGLQGNAEKSYDQLSSNVNAEGESDVLLSNGHEKEEFLTEEVPVEGGVVIVNYHSIEDDRIPMHPGRVRAESPLTMWRFQDVTHRERALRGSDQDMSVRYTEIEVQVLVDSKGYIPVWFINSIQRLWPARAMSAFNKLIKKNNPKKNLENSQKCSSLSYLTACSKGVEPFQPVAHW